MELLHTPANRFQDLKDYPFQPHFIEAGKLHIHYIDEGPAEAEPVLLLHGVPAWSYLYRHMISKLKDTDIRVIAPDLAGFGKSDKPVKVSCHTYQSHVDWLTYLIRKLGLKNITLFCHDWGALIGLRIAAQNPELFSGIIVSNGMLPTGEQKLHLLFKLWKIFARFSPFIPVDLVVGKGTLRKLDREERKAYRAPFPSIKYKTAVRSLPGLVPLFPSHPDALENRKTWELLSKWEKPFLTVFGNSDPITLGGDKYMQERIPGSVGQEHVRLDAGHFIQEDRSTELTEIIIRFRKSIISK